MIRSVLKEELVALRDKYGDERKTEIQDVENEIDIEDLIEEEECVFTLSQNGYIKRVPTTYRSRTGAARASPPPPSGRRTGWPTCSPPPPTTISSSSPTPDKVFCGRRAT
jgi:hypothetical protein